MLDRQREHFLSDDSVKAPVHQVSVTEDGQNMDESQKQNDEETPTQGRNGRYLKAKVPRSVERMPILSK